MLAQGPIAHYCVSNTWVLLACLCHRTDPIFEPLLFYKPPHAQYFYAPAGRVRSLKTNSAGSRPMWSKRIFAGGQPSASNLLRV